MILFGKVIMLLLAVAILGLNTGCASYMVYRGSEKQVMMKKATAAGDEAAIRAIRMGGDGVGIGIDVSNLEALSERPFLQFGAACLDALLMYGAYEGVRALDGDDGDDSSSSSGDSVSISVTGSSDTTITVENNTTTTDTTDQSQAGDGNTR